MKLEKVWKYQITMMETSADSYTYSLDDAPSDMTLDDKGYMEWTPNMVGKFPVTVRVRDNLEREVTQSFVIDVKKQ
jgi:hypothetical protein